MVAPAIDSAASAAVPILFIEDCIPNSPLAVASPLRKFASACWRSCRAREFTLNACSGFPPRAEQHRGRDGDRCKPSLCKRAVALSGAQRGMTPAGFARGVKTACPRVNRARRSARHIL
jgi:hypothetical protein